MKSLVIFIEQVERSKIKNKRGSFEYVYSKVKVDNFYFFRREKLLNGKVTSKSYAMNIESRLWEASINEFLRLNQ